MFAYSGRTGADFHPVVHCFSAEEKCSMLSALEVLPTRLKSHKADQGDRMQLYAQGNQRHSSFPHMGTCLGGEFS